MTNDANWVEDVKRWCLAGVAASRSGAPAESTDLMALGYEAAHPALQAQYWPDSPSSLFSESR